MKTCGAIAIWKAEGVRLVCVMRGHGGDHAGEVYPLDDEKEATPS